MGKELERVGKLLEGTNVVSPLAFYVNYESEWAKTGPDVRAFDDRRADYYKAFKRLGVNIDVTGRGRDLTRYKIVFAPMLYMVNGEMVEQFTRFVRQGGTLVLTFRSGVKEWDNSVTMQPLPGRLRELTGIEIEEFEPLLKMDPELEDGEMPLEGTAVPFAARTSSGTIWADILEPKGAAVLARYGKKFYAGKAAVTVNRVGEGRVVYIGTHLGRDFADSLTTWLLAQHRIETPFAVPDMVDVSSREQAGKKIHFLMNFNDTAQAVRLPRMCHNVLADREVVGSVAIPPRELLILSEG
jgi:beta-galactosidase